MFSCAPLFSDNRRLPGGIGRVSERWWGHRFLWAELRWVRLVISFYSTSLWVCQCVSVCRSSPSQDSRLPADWSFSYILLWLPLTGCHPFCDTSWFYIVICRGGNVMHAIQLIKGIGILFIITCMVDLCKQLSQLAYLSILRLQPTDWNWKDSCANYLTAEILNYSTFQIALISCLGVQYLNISLLDVKPQLKNKKIL